MALLFIDGFDHYAANDVLKKWTMFTEEMSESLIGFNSGRFSGNSLTTNLTALITHDSAIVKDINPSSSEVFAGVAVKYSGNILSNSEAYIFILYDSAGTETMGVYIDSTGKVNVNRGTPTTPTVLGSSATSLNQDSWNYIEIRYIPSNTVGVVEVRINETTEINVTGTDTTAGLEDIGSIGIGGNQTDAVLFFDDMYVLDTSGTSNNTYLGDVTVYTEVPTTDTTEASFSPSTGTDHFAMVDDAADIDDDSTYVENATLGATDRYTSAALGVTGTVHGVQISTTSRKTDTKARGFKASIKSGATEKEDTGEHTLTASYIVYRDIYEVDPNTSSAWTVTNVDSLEFGFKITTAE